MFNRTSETKPSRFHMDKVIPNYLGHGIMYLVVLLLLVSCAPATESIVMVPAPTYTPRLIVIIPSTPSPCMMRVSFGDSSASPYILPYPEGESYRVTQTYCDPSGGHITQQAYDFGMPVGADVIAARAGVVRDIYDETPDFGAWDFWDTPEQHNYVYIQHEDGTVAFYAHLKQNSILVEVGEHVDIGQKIAESGNSGITGGRPHLHFGVYGAYPVSEGFDVSVNFRNADGQLDERGGLQKWRYYPALSYR